jgi:hypothetical protein
MAARRRRAAMKLNAGCDLLVSAPMLAPAVVMLASGEGWLGTLALPLMEITRIERQ